jgi:TonB-dependent receptor
MSVKRNALVSTALTGVLMMSAVSAQTAPPPPASGDDVSEIVVSGFRKSLESALQAKKDDDRIIAVISAEDIGKLPAENIAEAIQRVPGVQMQNINGRGSTISLRGMPPNYVGTTLDDQDFASPGFINGFRFDLIQPELASSLEVVKSPSADMDSGFLAGNVNIKTTRPLDTDKPALVVSTKGQWSPFADNGATPKGAATFVDQFYGGKLGIAVGAVYQGLNDRADYAYMDKWNGDYNDPDGDGTLSPNRLRFRRIDRESKRSQFSATIEAKPNSDLDFGLTGVLSRDITLEDIQQQVIFFGGYGGQTLPYNILQVSNRTATVISGDAGVENNRQIENTDLRTESLILDGKWTPNDSWQIKGAASYSEGTSYDTQRAAIAAEILHNVTLNISNPNNVIFTSGTSLSDPAGYQPGVNLRDEYPDGSQTQDVVRKQSAQLDAKYFLVGVPVVSAINVGVKVKEETFGQYATRADQSGAGVTTPVADQPTWSSANGYASNFLDGIASFPSSWINPNISAYQSSLVADGLTPATAFDPSNTFHIKRDIQSAYAKADVDTKVGGLPIRGNFGVRLEETQQSLGGYTYDPNAPNPLDNNVNLETGTFKTSQHYFNALPSLNLTADLTPDLLVRFAAAKVLERASLDANSTNFATTVSQSNVGGVQTYSVNQGDDMLRPLTAKQADLSLEYYYGQGDNLSIAPFYKSIKNSTETEVICPSSFQGVALSTNSNGCFGTNGAEYDITAITNNAATIQLAGTEVTWTQNLDAILPIKGFGFTNNYTYVQQYAPTNAQPLHQLSKHTFNNTVYWGNDEFSARLSTNYRSSYYQYSYNESFFAREGHTINGRTQLDIALGYNYNDKLSFTFTGQNINYAPLETAYDGLSSRWQETAYAGAVYTIGMSYKFF